MKKRKMWSTCTDKDSDSGRVRVSGAEIEIELAIKRQTCKQASIVVTRTVKSECAVWSNECIANGLNAVFEVEWAAG